MMTAEELKELRQIARQITLDTDMYQHNLWEFIEERQKEVDADQTLWGKFLDDKEGPKREQCAVMLRSDYGKLPMYHMGTHGSTAGRVVEVHVEWQCALEAGHAGPHNVAQNALHMVWAD